jgi:chromosome segregation ATPase
MSEEQFRAVLEHYTKEVKAAAEVSIMVSQRLDRFQVEIKEQFDDAAARFAHFAETVHDRFDKLETRFAGLDTKVTKLDTKVTELDTKVTELDTKVTELDTKVTELEVVSRDTLQRVDRVEAQLGTLATDMNQRFDRVETRLEDVATDTQQRLTRVEHHLQLKPLRSARTPPRATRTPLSKRYRKS